MMGKNYINALFAVSVQNKQHENALIGMRLALSKMDTIKNRFVCHKEHLVTDTHVKTGLASTDNYLAKYKAIESDS